MLCYVYYTLKKGLKVEELNANSTLLVHAHAKERAYAFDGLGVPFHVDE